MKVEKKLSEGLNHAYTITIPFSSITEKKDAKLKKIAKTAKMDGFRPGKVPLSVLEQRYSGQLISDIISDFIDDESHNVIHENKIKLAAKPKAEIVSFEEGQDLVFDLNIEAMPNVEIKDFSSISLVKPVLTLEEGKVEKELEEIRARQKSFKEADASHAATEEDRVVFSLEASYAGGAVIKDLTSDHMTLLVDQNFAVPEISGALKGLKKDDVKILENITLNDIGDKKYKNKKINFKIVVKSVEQPTETVLNEELAKKFGYDDLAAWKEEVKKRLQEELDSYARLYVKRFLLDNLSDSYTFDVPQSMIDKEFNQIWEKLQEEIKAAKEAGDEIEELTKSEDDLKAEYQTIAARRVRLGLIISEISESNKISLTKDEINKAAWKEALRFGHLFQQAYNYILKNKAALQTAAAPALEDKVIDFILEKVKLETKDMSFDEFKKIAEGVIPVDFSEEENA